MPISEEKRHFDPNGGSYGAIGSLLIKLSYPTLDNFSGQLILLFQLFACISEVALSRIQTSTSLSEKLSFLASR
jgi:hypothetical protein